VDRNADDEARLFESMNDRLPKKETVAVKF
jgi:hypothetical protein